MRRTSLILTISMFTVFLTGTACAADLPVISSWIGNTWDGVRHAQMPLTADDIGVSGDGIVSMGTHYNDGRLSMFVLHDGLWLGAAYYTGNCHKWLCAPKRPGFRIPIKLLGENRGS